MWRERQAEKLSDEIGLVIEPFSDIVGFYDLIQEPLTKIKRGLADIRAEERPWSLLPLIVCEAISGHYEPALPAAAAHQLLITAADVFDDVEDADSTESLSAKHGIALAINAATTLLILAEQTIIRLKERGVEDGIIIRVVNAVNSFYATACAGQHLDLSLGSEISISEEDYLRIIKMKSASQMECACHIGALLAKANQKLTRLLSTFGRNLGMASQITNDIQGIIHGNDIVNRKVTLPVIYALTQKQNTVYNQFLIAFNKHSESLPDPTLIKRLLFNVGAIYYATIKMEYYKQLALDNLSEAEKAGVDVKRLRLFLKDKNSHE